MGDVSDDRLKTAVDALDLEAAVRLLTGAAMFVLHSEPSIGLASMVFSDGPAGVRGPSFPGEREVSLLPNATLLSSTWDVDVAQRVGAILAEEARVQGVHVVLAPTVNLHRTPLGGRLFEAFSEDPLLTGLFAAGYVRGTQAGGVGACLKAYVAYETETDRHGVDLRVDERALRELYLLPFEIAVADGGAWTVMAAYNAVNGVTVTEHDALINGVLKGEWGFDGLVMSDWFATTSTVASVNGGLDLVMPGPGGPWEGALIDAVRAGAVSETTVREHVRRLLRLAGRVGAFPAPAVTPSRPLVDPAGPDRRAELRELAAAGMTVLTNRGDVLPVDPAACTPDAPLVVVGRHALQTVVQGGGSAQVRPPHRVGIADGLRAALGADRVRVLDGVEVRSQPEPADAAFVRDPETGAPGVRITSRGSGGEERASTSGPLAALLLNQVGGPHDGAATVELQARLGESPTGEVEIGVLGTGSWTIALDGTRYAVELAAAPGSDVAAAVLDPPTWTVQVPAGQGARLVATYRNDPERPAMVGLLARPAPAPDHELIAATAEAAAGADPAVVVVGLTSEQETESRDKTTLVLPGAQDALVRAVAAAARRTVVVVNAATPVLMPWLGDVDAVLWAGLPGQEAGHAVADVLLGRREATGRLVTTFPAADGDGPAWSPVPTGGALEYTEGVAVGYRGWHADPDGPAPLFWFGHGLGWTSWAYHGVTAADPDTVLVEIENTGLRVGREVVQVYLLPDDEPVRLAGWVVAADVAPGERRTVPVVLDPRMRRRWTINGWEPLPSGRLLVARGLGDVRVEVDR